MKPNSCAGLLATLVAALLLSGAGAVVADGDPPALRLPLVARDAEPAYPVNRVGVGFLHDGALADYPLDRLPFGWYSDYSYSAAPERPGGVAYVQLLPVGKYKDPPTYPPDWSKVEAAVRANPGAVWIVGNEPECLVTAGYVYQQGNLTPQEYAEVYHEYYTRIIGWDPTARFAIGGVVQPSPARFLWLERALRAYEDKGEGPMPIDVWTIHNMLLEEDPIVDLPDRPWGAGVPRGIEAEDWPQLQSKYPWWPIPERLVGGLMRYAPCDNRRPDYFEKQLWAFRRWMADNGFRHMELWITEYGVLYPAVYPGSTTYWPLFAGWYGFECVGPMPANMEEAEAMGVDLVNAFMSRTLDYAASARDADYGCARDDNRLVQRWLWYSLNGKTHEEDPHHGFNGSLCDWQFPHELTPYGLHCAQAP